MMSEEDHLIWAFADGPPPAPVPPLPPLPPLPPPMPLPSIAHLQAALPPDLAPRVRRGDVRSALLALLAEEPRNGYQMIEEIARRSGGVWRPSPGSVYPALQQLEDEGLVTAQESGGSRVYQLTDAGRAAEVTPEPWNDVVRSLPEDRHELRLLWGQLAEAFLHLSRVATDGQVAETKKLLKEARRGMFRILAEDE
jgi:DNA-binding PadR family transcriptional regulator